MTWWVVGLVAGLSCLGFAAVCVWKGLGSTGAFKAKIPGFGSVDLSGMTTVFVVAGFVLFVLSLVKLSDETTTRPTAPGGVANSPAFSGSSSASPRSLDEPLLERALNEGVARARAYGGAVQAAVWVTGSGKPIIAGDDLEKPIRAWSMVRVATSIAAYRAAVERGQARPSPTLTDALRGAIVHAENCRHFRAVLGLQELAGGPNAARAAVTKVFTDAGAETFRATQEETEPSSDCEPYLVRAGQGLQKPLADGVAFGQSLWTVGDAIALAHGLATGAFGDAGRFTLALMREPKKENRDLALLERLKAPLDWGAGNVLARWKPAYKGGWGGQKLKNVGYLAGQVAVIDVSGRSVAVAAIFHPAEQPQSEDPSVAGVIEPIEAVLAELSNGFAAAG